MAKATTDEVEKRVDEVFRMLIAGTPFHKIVQHASENWDVGERQTREYVGRAKKLLANSAKVKRETEFGKALLRLDDLYGRALKLHDFRTALSVQREINAVMGHYPPAKTENQTTLKGEINIRWANELDDHAPPIT